MRRYQGYYITGSKQKNTFFSEKPKIIGIGYCALLSAVLKYMGQLNMPYQEWQRERPDEATATCNWDLIFHSKVLIPAAELSDELYRKMRA